MGERNDAIVTHRFPFPAERIFTGVSFAIGTNRKSVNMAFAWRIVVRLCWRVPARRDKERAKSDREE